MMQATMMQATMMQITMTTRRTSRPDAPRRPNPASPEGYASVFHAPVMAGAAVRALVADPRGCYVDATLGGGGHAAALLEAHAPEAQVLGIDRDAEALAEARTRLAHDDRFRAVQGNFGDLEALLQAEGTGPVDGLLLDLGVSSHQIDTAARGFSFQREGPLDMRMDRRGGRTAEAVVNTWDERELKELLYTYGEERRAPRIARALAEARPLGTTAELAEAVRGAVPERDEVKTLARVFQALRIAVNTELEALEQALEAGPSVLKAGGRMAVISYHSLEDRRVKRFFKYGNFENQPVRDIYGNLISPWRPDSVHGPVRPDEDEVAGNPRSRSARLRWAERRDEDPETSAPYPG